VRNVKLKGSLGCSDHEMVEFKILRAARRAHSKLTAWDFMRADPGLLRDLLGRVPWDKAGACTDRTKSSGFELKDGRFRLDIRQKFFAMRVVRPWHMLPREAVAAPSLAVFKANLDGALSNLV